MNSTELSRALETQEEPSIRSAPTSSLSRIRPILENSKAGIFNRDMLNQLLKTRLRSVLKRASGPRIFAARYNKIKRYRKQGSVGRMSQFLSEFQLNPLDPSKFKLKYLLRFTKSLRRLQNTKFGLRFGTSQIYLHLDKVDYTFKAFKNITWAEFNFSIYQHPTGESLKNLLTRVQSLKRLETLKLNVSKGFSQGLQGLSRGIKRLKNLRSLQLVFEEHEEIMEDNSLEQLLSEVGKLEGLSGLSLRFIKCSKIASGSLLSIAVCLKKLKSLTKFAFIMSECQAVSHESLNELRQGLESLKMLSVLKLDFYSCIGVSDLGITRLGEGLQELKSLISLDLSFNNCPNVGDQGLCDLFVQLKNCRMLKRIVFNAFQNFNLGDTPLITLGPLFKELEQLTEINLSFASFTSKITEEGFQSFYENLKPLQNIKTLKLNFSKCVESTDKSLLTLASSLKAWAYLEDLSLDFYYPSQITEEGVKVFCIALKSLGSLSRIYLVFPPCSETIQKEIKDLLGSRKCTLIFNSTEGK